MSTNSKQTKTQKEIAKAMSLYTKEALAKMDMGIVQAYSEADNAQSNALHALYIELAKARRGQLHLAHGITKFDEYVTSLLKGSILEKSEVSKQSASKYADAGDALLLMPELQKTTTGLQALQTLKQTASKLSDDGKTQEVEDLKGKVAEAVKQGASNISQSDAKTIHDLYIAPKDKPHKQYDYLFDWQFDSKEWTTGGENTVTTWDDDGNPVTILFDKAVTLIKKDTYSLVALIMGEDEEHIHIARRRPHIESKVKKRKNAEVFMYTAEDAERALAYKLAHPEDVRSLTEILHELVK